MTERRTCLGCSRKFVPRAGGSPQEFHSVACKHAFETAARRFVRNEIKAGRLSIAAVKGSDPRKRSARAVLGASGD